MLYSRSRVVLGAALLALTLSSCESSTGPGTPTESPVFEGLLDFQLLGTHGRPFGLGMSSAGKALALQLDVETAARFLFTADTVFSFTSIANNAIDVAFTSSGSRAYVTILDGSRVYEVNMSTGAVIDSVTFGQSHHRILMHPDNSKFWVFGIGGKVWAVDRVTGARTDSVTATANVIRGVSRRSDGTIALGAGPEVVLLNSATLDVITSASLGTTTQEVVYSHDGASIFVALEDAGKVMVLNATTLAKTDSIMFTPTPMSPFGMRLSPDGHTLLVSSGLTGRVAVINADTHAVVRILDTGGTPRRIAFSPAGGSAFVTNEDGWIDVIK